MEGAAEPGKPRIAPGRSDEADAERDAVRQQGRRHCQRTEIKQVHEGMMIALPPEDWTIFRTMSVARFADGLKKMAAHMDLDYYRKSKRGPKKPPPPMDQYRNGGHVSTYKLLKEKDP